MDIGKSIGEISGGILKYSSVNDANVVRKVENIRQGICTCFTLLSCIYFEKMKKYFQSSITLKYILSWKNKNMAHYYRPISRDSSRFSTTECVKSVQ